MDLGDTTGCFQLFTNNEVPTGGLGIYIRIQPGSDRDSSTPLVFTLFSTDTVVTSKLGINPSKNSKKEIEARVLEETVFNFSKIHLFCHFSDVIHRFGSLPQYLCNTGEIAH